jgi:hypothetical protein
MFTCVYCEKVFSSKHNVIRHQGICKSKKNHVIEMNQKIEFLQAQHQKELQSLEKEKKREIEALTKQLKIQENQLEKEKKREIEALIKQLKTQENQVKELQNQIFELAKQPKNNITQNTNNHNQRTLNIINQLAPYDLTEKSVRATVEKHYDKEMMLKGPEGLVQFVVEYVLTQPETGKKKMLCSDMSRKCGKYLSPDGKSLVKDFKMNHTLDLISPPLCRANINAMNEVSDNPKITIRDRSYYHDRGMTNMSFISDRNRFSTRLAGQLALKDPVSDSNDASDVLEHSEQKEYESEELDETYEAVETIMR